MWAISKAESRSQHTYTQTCTSIHFIEFIFNHETVYSNESRPLSQNVKHHIHWLHSIGELDLIFFSGSSTNQMLLDSFDLDLFNFEINAVMPEKMLKYANVTVQLNTRSARFKAKNARNPNM